LDEKSYCNSKHGIAVASGTDALTIALKALGITYGDEIITVANTCIPTVCGIENAGGTPAFVDIEQDSYTINPALIEDKITY